tara:strand:+ start:440 stop:628 length:189 start_codon:yes stop_codon:yes gene_type:complete
MTIEFPLSPRIRKSPYFEATLRWGAKGFLVYNKTYLPMDYRSLEEEFWHGDRWHRRRPHATP